MADGDRRHHDHAAPGIIPTKPGSATRPFPGIFVDIYDEDDKPIEGAGKGNLVVTKPWPGMLRTIYKDPERYRETYWERLGDKYFVEDGAERDEDGYYTITGRIDDVMNVSGHRIGTMEVERARLPQSRSRVRRYRAVRRG